MMSKKLTVQTKQVVSSASTLSCPITVMENHSTRTEDSSDVSSAGIPDLSCETALGGLPNQKPKNNATGTPNLNLVKGRLLAPNSFLTSNKELTLHVETCWRIAALERMKFTVLLDELPYEVETHALRRGNHFFLRNSDGGVVEIIRSHDDRYDVFGTRPLMAGMKGRRGSWTSKVFYPWLQIARRQKRKGKYNLTVEYYRNPECCVWYSKQSVAPNDIETTINSTFSSPASASIEMQSKTLLVVRIAPNIDPAVMVSIALAVRGFRP